MPAGIQNLKGFLGYWKSSYSFDCAEHLPDPHNYVDEAWAKTAECTQVIAHLKAGRILESWRGSSWCRFGCEIQNGSHCLTDGTYAWPEGFAHYLEHHAVKPPQEFIDHIMRLP
jgi:hypothetical protein